MRPRRGLRVRPRPRPLHAHPRSPASPARSRTRFLCGERFTEADLRLFPTIIRFDPVYSILFKCSARRVAEHPHLAAWMRDVHQLRVPGGGLQVEVRARRNALAAWRPRCLPTHRTANCRTALTWRMLGAATFSSSSP